jgi:phage recombination protein Bet
MSEEIQKYETEAPAKKPARTAAVAVPAGTKGTSVLARLAARFGVDPAKMGECLKATAFKGGATNEQIMALCIVADQYGLNPWTKEIYAFPDKTNGIVPVVGVDGWSRIINEHEQFDGMEFEQDAESCTCTIFRKDRAHPVSVTEYLSECQRNTGPWSSHPRRMLRHKALVQCARLAFGYAGIYDQDEAERIVEGAIVTPPPYDLPKKKVPDVQPLADETTEAPKGDAQ